MWIWFKDFLLFICNPFYKIIANQQTIFSSIKNFSVTYPQCNGIEFPFCIGLLVTSTHILALPHCVNAGHCEIGWEIKYIVIKYGEYFTSILCVQYNHWSERGHEITKELSIQSLALYSDQSLIQTLDKNVPQCQIS